MLARNILEIGAGYTDEILILASSRQDCQRE